MNRVGTMTAFVTSFFLLGIGSPVASGSSTVNMNILASSALTVSGNPGILSVNLNAAGIGMANDSSTTYTVRSNANTPGRFAILGQIATGGDMPRHTSLLLRLASKAGVSQGAQSLNSKRAVNLVTGLPTVVADTQPVMYTFRVRNGWSIPAQSLSKTVILTLIATN